MKTIINIIVIGLIMLPLMIFAQQNKEKKIHPIPKIISYNPESKQYQPLLEGEKDSAVFYSGVVTLLPDSAGKVHSTKNYEEMIIPLKGKGIVKFNKHQARSLTYGQIALIPPLTEHQIVNTGKDVLKYIYVATKVKQ